MTVHRYIHKIGWSTKRQAAFGTALAKTDLTEHVKLAEPAILDENAEHWTDRGMIGKDTDFERQRGKTRQWIRFELPAQALSVDFIGYLIALFFGSESHSTISTNVNQHVAKFLPLATLASAYTTTFAVYEDGNDYYVQDLAITSLTIRGEGDGRIQAGASFVGSKIGGSLSSYTWPTVADMRPVYNYAGTFTFESDMKDQLRSFELTLKSGINMDLAWYKAAATANRIYPQAWPYTPDRSLAMTLTIIAASGDLATYRAAQQAGTEMALSLGCLGEEVTDSDPTDYDEVLIDIPKAVITNVSHAFVNGQLQLTMNLDGHYDTTGDLNSPIEVTTREGSAGEYIVAAS